MTTTTARPAEIARMPGVHGYATAANAERVLTKALAGVTFEQATGLVAVNGKGRFVPVVILRRDAGDLALTLVRRGCYVTN